MLSLIRGRRAAERSGTTMANALRHVLAGPGPFARARSFGIDAAEARHARYARLARWRRAAPASAPALASLDGARGYHRGRDAHAAPRREIMSNALSVPRDATEEEEDSDDALLRAEGGAAPILKRFNGDKMSLHQSPANGSTNARRAAAQGTRARRPPCAEFPRTRQKENRGPARLPRFLHAGTRLRFVFFFVSPLARAPSSLTVPHPPHPHPPPTIHVRHPPIHTPCPHKVSISTRAFAAARTPPRLPPPPPTPPPPLRRRVTSPVSSTRSRSSRLSRTRGGFSRS